MKKLLFIMGSPRKNGNTSTILNKLTTELNGKFDIETLNIVDYKINGCTGCSKCQKSDLFKCVQNDDINALLEKLISADAIIYATPLYGHNYSGQMKIFLDRHVPLFKFVEGDDKSVHEMKILSALKDTPAGLIVSCQGPVAYNTELISMLFDKFCESSLTQCLGKYVFPFCNPESSKTLLDQETFSSLLSDLKVLLAPEQE